VAQPVNLRSVRALTELRDRLSHFSSSVRDHADCARDQLRSHSYRLEEIGRARLDELSDAYDTLAALDEDDDGWAERRRLEAAQEAMQEFREVASELQDAQSRFQTQLSRFAGRGSSLAATAIEAISAKIAAAEAYLAIQVPSATGGVRSADAGGASPGSAGHAGSTSATVAADDLGPLPPGFAWVRLKDLSGEDFIEDPALFEKVDHARMLRGVALLRDEILPRVNANPALGRDDVARLDAERGTAWTAQGFPHPESLATIWDAFLDKRREADVVVISRIPDGRYEVINGRHRLGIARKLGMTAIPCKMTGAGS
jgi:hypothetical protein